MASEPWMMYLQDVIPAFLSSSLLRRSLLLGTLVGGVCCAVPVASVQAAAAVKTKSKPKAGATPDRQAIGQTVLHDFQRKHQAIEILVAKRAKDTALAAQVDTLLNYQALAQSALGSNHASICNTRCAEFEHALTDLIRSNYLRFLRQAKKGRVEYLGAQVGRKGNAVKIKTIVHRNKAKAGSRTNKVQVSYILQRKGNEAWKVVDIITEGVSLRKTYRYEFQKILARPGSEGGIGGVIKKIKDKLAQSLAPAGKKP